LAYRAVLKIAYIWKEIVFFIGIGLFERGKFFTCIKIMFSTRRVKADVKDKKNL